jgi:hypothetical protein
MYIVLTFDSLFMVHMLTYVLTKFNTRSANNLQ